VFVLILIKGGGDKVFQFIVNHTMRFTELKDIIFSGKGTSEQFKEYNERKAAMIKFKKS